jgi:ubiquinone/menaquinone biosynthesis C-methylase UbiE
MKKIKPNFGKLVKAYDMARSSYPERAMRFVRRAIKGKNPLVLDIGCGTGISTRQMAHSGATVIGCDIDEKMLEAARAHKENNVAYVCAPANKLPFRDYTFDAVTACQALHWFADNKSLRELKRVLKKGGVLCVVQPKRTGHARRKELLEIFQEHFPVRLPPHYMKRDFIEVLKIAGFKQYRSFSVKAVDRRSMKDFLLLIQSFSIWNTVPEAKQRYMLNVLRKHYRPMLERGRIEDRHEITVLVVRR